MLKPKRNSNCLEDLSPEASEAILETLKAAVLQTSEGGLSAHRQCLARELCLRSQSPAGIYGKRVSVSGVKKAVYLLQSLALLYMGLDDRSQAFGDFLDQRVNNKEAEIDCFEMFPNCGINKEYLL